MVTQFSNETVNTLPTLQRSIVIMSMPSRWEEIYQTFFVQRYKKAEYIYKQIKYHIVICK